MNNTETQLWFERTNGVMRSLGRNLFRLLLWIGAFYLAYHLRGIIMTVLIGVIIAYVFQPLVEILMQSELFNQCHAFIGPRGDPHKRRHSLRGAATLYVLLLSVCALILSGFWIVKPIQKQVTALVNNRENIIRNYRQRAPMWLQTAIDDKMGDEEFKAHVQEAATPIAMKGVSSLKYIVELVLLPVLAFYFVLDGHTLKREFIVVAPRKYRRETTRMLSEFNQIMHEYVKGQFLLCLLAFIMIGLFLWCIGVDNAFTLGIVAGLTRAIPIVGPIIGGIPIIALTYLSDAEGPHKAALVLAFFTFLHFAESKFIMPMLIGDRVELHPVVIIIVLLVGGEVGTLILGGTLGSLLGMFFAAPVASMMRSMFRRYVLKIRHSHGLPGHPHIAVNPPVSATAADLMD